MPHKYSLQDMADIVDTEGLGYAIENYISWEEIDDRDLATLWRIADIAMVQIRELLPPGE